MLINSVDISNLAAGMKRQAWYVGLQNDGIENQISAFSKPDFFLKQTRILEHAGFLSTQGI
jgi:hypothetical protein